MKLKLDIDPDLVAMMAAEIKAGEKAVSAAMREAGTGLKSDWRAQSTGTHLGRRLANSILLATYPKAGDSLNAAALVWSKASEIIGAHDTSPLNRSKDGLAGNSHARRRQIYAWRSDHPQRVETAARIVPAVRLSLTGLSLLFAEGRLNTRGIPKQTKKRVVRHFEQRGEKAPSFGLSVIRLGIEGRHQAAVQLAETAAEGVTKRSAHWVQGSATLTVVSFANLYKAAERIRR